MYASNFLVTDYWPTLKRIKGQRNLGWPVLWLKKWSVRNVQMSSWIATTQRLIVSLIWLWLRALAHEDIIDVSLNGHQCQDSTSSFLFLWGESWTLIWPFIPSSLFMCVHTSKSMTPARGQHINIREGRSVSSVSLSFLISLGPHHQQLKELIVRDNEKEERKQKGNANATNILWLINHGLITK